MPRLAHGGGGSHCVGRAPVIPLLEAYCGASRCVPPPLQCEVGDTHEPVCVCAAQLTPWSYRPCWDASWGGGGVWPRAPRCGGWGQGSSWGWGGGFERAAGHMCHGGGEKIGGSDFLLPTTPTPPTKSLHRTGNGPNNPPNPCPQHTRRAHDAGRRAHAKRCPLPIEGGRALKGKKHGIWDPHGNPVGGAPFRNAWGQCASEQTTRRPLP